VKQEVKNTYWGYGLRIESDFLLPELQVVKDEGKSDIIIKRAISVPITLENATEKGVRFEASKEEFLLKIDNIARFHVKNGKEIIVQPFEASHEEDIRVFLLSSVFAALLDQRGYLVLNAACIEINGRAILFTGVSGVGKSTLAAAFRKRGYKILTDEICAIKISQKGIPIAIPAFPKLKIWEDSAEKLGEDINSLLPVRRNLKKYMIDVEEQFSKFPLPISIIYLLKSENNKEISVIEIKDSSKIDTITDNAYRFRFRKAHGEKVFHLKQCIKLAINTDMYSVSRPNKEFDLDELVLILEKEIKRLWQK
jgi:hypothetical protein